MRSLQGALQLQQDFALVRDLVQSEHYGLAPETRQSLLSLRVFQQMDSAILCLLQQPSGKAYLSSHPWPSLRQCCESGRGHGWEPPAHSSHGAWLGLLIPPRCWGARDGGHGAGPHPCYDPVSSPHPGSNDGARTQELGASSLHSLETLEAPGAAAGPPPDSPSAEPPGRLRAPPESYLAGSQQQWLALRLRGARRWRVPGLPCMAKSPEG